MTIMEHTATAVWTVDTPLSEYYDQEPPLRIRYRDLPVDSIQLRMYIILLVATAVIIIFAFMVLPRLLSIEASTMIAADTNITTQIDETIPEISEITPVVSGAISPVFSPEVQHWGAQIVEWSSRFDLDPNMIATIMQIESCGDPLAISSAGAQGLFQVMPFHFLPGDDMLNPETNAMKGLSYFSERLQQTSGEVGNAFAGYNGGHVAAGTTWNNWAHETQRYYVWSTGIYAEAAAGAPHSETLQQWMAAGGASLCSQAANRLGL
jgi:hypothetical protein